MMKSIRLLAAAAPFAVVALLAWSVFGSLQLLDSSFAYVGPKNDLPEDVYGFGFAGVWLALLPPFIILCLLSRYFAGLDHSKYWIPLVGAYACCSIGGFWLDHIIWPQLIH
jgi:hypothetical protein